MQKIYACAVVSALYSLSQRKYPEQRRNAIPKPKKMTTSGLEPLTVALLVLRSNQLSYAADFIYG
jgi:hypothetical protein